LKPWNCGIVARFVLGIPVALALGCTSSHGAADASDAGDTEAGPSVSCAKDSRIDTYVANLTKASADGSLKVTLVSSDPAPPARGTNTWTMKLANGTGAPISGAALSIASLMPDHGHGSSVDAVVTDQGNGVYSVAPVDLFMPGVWRVTFSIPGPDGGVSPTVAYFFSIAG
jgi:hypothetical protein